MVTKLKIIILVTYLKVHKNVSFLGMFPEKGPDLETTVLSMNLGFSLDTIGTYIQRMAIPIKQLNLSISVTLGKMC